MERVCSGSKATEKNPSGPKGLEGLRYPQKCIPAGRATLSREIAQTSPRVRRDLRIKHRLAPIPHAATNREVARICIRTRKTRVNHHQRKKRPGGWPNPLANRRSKIRPWIGEVQVAFTPSAKTGRENRFVSGSLMNGSQRSRRWYPPSATDALSPMPVGIGDGAWMPR